VLLRKGPLAVWRESQRNGMRTPSYLCTAGERPASAKEVGDSGGELLALLVGESMTCKR